MKQICSKRVQYYKHHTGLCVLPEHGDDVDHLVEMVTPDVGTGKYHQTKEVQMTRILITGSRDWDDPAVIEAALLEFVDLPDVTLVSGACPNGADFLCEEFAHAHGWRVELHPADWDRHGKSAGFKRNCEMVESKPDYCIAFIRNESKGATQTRDMALFRGIHTETYTYEEKTVFQRYVVGFAFDQDKRVALIRKSRPAWQEGLLNGVGGKIEEGETPLQAMIREFDEEAGLLIDSWEVFATLRYPDSEIVFLKALVPVEYLDGLESVTDELVRVVPASSLKTFQMVRNLQWILPLALYTDATYLPIDVVVSEFGPEGNPPS